MLVLGVMDGNGPSMPGYGSVFVLAWIVASAATVGGGLGSLLGSGLESDEAIRAAAYSKREEERRRPLAAERAS